MKAKPATSTSWQIHILNVFLLNTVISSWALDWVLIEIYFMPCQLFYVLSEKKRKKKKKERKTQKKLFYAP